MQFLENLSSWDSQLFDRLGNVVSSRLNNWLLEHPLIHWLFERPLISAIAFVVAVVLLIRLLLTIYRAVAATIDRMWMWLLSLPWLLLRFLFGWSAKPKLESGNTNITNYEVTSDPQQLKDILIRLEQIQQQQQQIMRDIDFLKQHPNPKNIDLNLTKAKLPPSQD